MKVYQRSILVNCDNHELTKRMDLRTLPGQPKSLLNAKSNHLGSIKDQLADIKFKLEAEYNCTDWQYYLTDIEEVDYGPERNPKA